MTIRYFPSGGPIWDLAAKTNVVFDYGDMVALDDTEGYVELGADEAGLVLCGVCVQALDMTGISSGDEAVKVDIGGAIVRVTYTAGSLDETFIGDRVFLDGKNAVDAVAGVSGDGSYAGVIIGIVRDAAGTLSTTECYVKLASMDNAGIGINDPA